MEPTSEPAERRPRAAALLRGAMECVVILMVCLAPWAFGAVQPAFEALLYAGVALLLLLWAVRALLEGTASWRRCPVTVCLAGLFLFGAAQVVPLPHGVLARLSPVAAELYHELLPADQEILPPPHSVPAVALPAGETLSLYPAGTREELLRLLAVFLLFVAVRNMASPGSLRRLAAAATINGAALALFAFLQFFSSPRGIMYWSVAAYSDASPFGPFICRNHFPFYVNLCIGLGAGLLQARRGTTAHSGTDRERSVSPAWWNPLEVLNDAPSLWIAAALAIMVAAVAFSLSRGGLVALVCGGAVCLGLRAAQSSRPAPWGGMLLAAALSLGLLAWLGAGPLRARLLTLWEGDALQEGRGEIWSDMLPAARDFPFTGTGYGTFVHVEQMYRKSPAHKGWIVEHAHNDYLEALIEGGFVRLLLSVAAVLFVYRLGWRALRRYRAQSTRGLVLGALLGFTAVAVHSFVDFGLHIPAVAVLTVVVAAHIAALGEKRPAPVRATTAAAPTWGNPLAALAGAATAVALALLLCAEGWRSARAESLRIGAGLAGGGDGLALIEAATQTTPDRAELHLAAGQAYLNRYEEHAAQAADGEERRRAEEEYLLPGLAHYVQARDLCPLSARANLRLAAHRGAFTNAEARAVYVERAERVLPSDPELYYLAGSLELADGERRQAIASWRRSLQLSDAYQALIVARAAGTLTDKELLDEILPDQPQQIVAAGSQRHPDADDAGRRPFQEKALRLLSASGAARSPAGLHLKAVLSEALGEPDQAAAAYEAALEQAPRETEWRCELVRLLLRQGRLKDARRQALAILADRPDHPEGLRLMRAVARDMAEKE